MLLKRIDKMAEVHNPLLDRHTIRNGFEGLVTVSLQEVVTCANCSRFDHIKLECLVMAIQGQGMFRQGPSGGLTQQGRPNFLGAYPKYYNTLVFNNNPSQHALFWKNNDQPYPLSYITHQYHQQPYANQRQSSFVLQMQSQAYMPTPR